MMNFAASVILLTFLSLCNADDLADCKCWDGYKAIKSEGAIQCEGIVIQRTMPCNIPQRPKCECTGKVTGIVSDLTGVWCSEYSKGKEKSRWPCENKEDWDKFYAAYPEEKPKPKE